MDLIKKPGEKIQNTKYKIIYIYNIINTYNLQ